MLSAVFVDRDGVINRDRPDYVKSWEEFVFLPHAVDALVELTARGIPMVILTNQSAINRGVVTREQVDDIHASMLAALAAAGARVAGVFYCPHRPDEGCSCRKPKPGLLLRAAEQLGIDLSRSYMIGDALTDIAAGQAAGCRSLLVLTGRGLAQFVGRPGRVHQGYSVSRDLRHAVKQVLVAEGLVGPGWLDRVRLRLPGAAW